ncbi:MAG TPA: hypothetical protein VE617_12340 [Propionibacteriaceae bacterium]|nr:hypothetical protein [Propionibacteriaceae bacterium]
MESKATGREPRPVPGNRPDDAEERSLDLVQRMVISALIIVVFGLFAGMLALYLAVYPEETSRSSTIGLWVMSGAFGLATAGAVLVVNRRRPYSPWVLLGFLPMAISAFWVL